MNQISSFLLKDHAPTQIFLYSIPAVNICVRTFQSYHSLDDVEDTQCFDIKKKNFKDHMTSAIQIQLASAILTLCLCILFPQVLPVGAVIGSTLFSLAFSNYLCDSFWRSDIAAPRISGSINAKGW